MLAARQSTPMKERAVFSERVATARHSFGLAQSRSTRLRLVSAPSGQATRALRCAWPGLPGVRPGSRGGRGRHGWRSPDPPPPGAARRASGPARARRGTTRAPARARPGRRRPDHRRPRRLRPWAIAAARAPKRLTFAAAAARVPFLDAPAALACALMLVPSRTAIPSSTPACLRPVEPSVPHAKRAQRMKICAAFHQGPSSAGMERHFAPFVQRQRSPPPCREGRRAAPWRGTARLDQGLQLRPLRIRQHHQTPAHRRSGEGGPSPRR